MHEFKHHCIKLETHAALNFARIDPNLQLQLHSKTAPQPPPAPLTFPNTDHSCPTVEQNKKKTRTTSNPACVD